MAASSVAWTGRRGTWDQGRSGLASGGKGGAFVPSGRLIRYIGFELNGTSRFCPDQIPNVGGELATVWEA